MKGYHNDRGTKTFETVGSRRDLIRAAIIGIPALVLAAASAGARPDRSPLEQNGSAADEVAFDEQPAREERMVRDYSPGAAGA